MRLRLLLVILTLFAALPMSAQSDDPLKGEIEPLKGKTVTLRHFYSDNDLHYAADGVLVGRSDSGPWTLTGRIRIEKVSVKEDHVQLEGSRVWVIFRDGNQVNGITRIFASLRIDVVQGPDRVEKWREALPKVLFTKGTPLSEDAPEYWKSYLAPPDEVPKPKPVAEASGNSETKDDTGGAKNDAGATKSTSGRAMTPEPSPLKTPTRVRVNQGVSEGLLIHKEVPHYPPEARAAHLQGQVVLQAVIGKDGHVKGLRIVSPAGVGLDDEAAKAVQQWVYRPYFLNGEPVEVDTQITINFTLSG